MMITQYINCNKISDMSFLCVILVCSSFHISRSSFVYAAAFTTVSPIQQDIYCCTRTSSNNGVTLIRRYSHNENDNFGFTIPPNPMNNKNNDGTDNLPSQSKIQIQTILWHMTQFWNTMIDPVSKRYYYMSLPTTKERYHQHMPIRDLAAIWDTTKILNFWKEHNTPIEHYHQEKLLKDAIIQSLEVYSTSFTSLLQKKEDGNHGASTSGVYLNSQVLLESPNIAHSALYILGTIHAIQLSLIEQPTTKIPLKDLTLGILSMQRSSDGAFYINFDERQKQQHQQQQSSETATTTSSNDGIDDKNVYRGIDFYPGEAMVALMGMYDLLEHQDLILTSSTSAQQLAVGDTDTREQLQQSILSTMEHAFDFYSKYYYQGGDDVDVNYNIWQIQAFAKYYNSLIDTRRMSTEHQHHYQELRQNVKKYCIELCHGILNSKAWKYELSRGRMFYPNLDTVEIGCGLDALADGIQLLVVSEDDDYKNNDDYNLFVRNAKNAIDFIEWSQNQVPRGSTGSTDNDDSFGYGGLGFGGTYVREQRLDVTGHAMSALIKLYPLLH